MARAGIAVDVICAKVPGVPSNETPHGVKIHRVRDFMSRAQMAGDMTRGGRRPPWWHRALRWIHRRTWRKLYWPDYACAWLVPAVIAARRLMATNHYDWLITVSHPFTGHFAGLAIKRAKPELRWLVDIGDPFCLMDDPAPNNTFLYRRLSRWADRSVLSRADVVTVTTIGTLRAYGSMFPQVSKKIHVIPPLLSLPAEISEAAKPVIGSQAKLVFVGTLYRNLRSPLALLGLFEQLVTARPDWPLELHFVGNTNDCLDLFKPYSHWLGSRLILHGVVSRERARALMEEARVLVNLGNYSSTQLPSKVIEYVALAKPILNLVTISDDSSVPILESYPAALSVHVPDRHWSENQLETISKFIGNPPVAHPETVQAWLRPYTTDSVTGSYIAQLRKRHDENETHNGTSATPLRSNEGES